MIKSTNNEKRPLFTMCGKTTHGKMFTFMRVFVPHENTWIFRWIFCVALPQLFVKSIVDQIKIIISDCDSQEIQQLDNVISLFLPNILRVRCCWHIVFMRGKAHMPRLNDMQRSNKKIFENIYHYKKLDI